MRRTMRPLVVLLAAFGVALAMTRGVDVVERRPSAGLADDEPARLEREGVYLVSRLIGIDSGTDRHRQLRVQFRAFYRKFDTYPLATLFHVVPAGVFSVLMLLQLSARVRRRASWWHRWSGRAALTLAIPVGVSGLFFGLTVPFGGRSEAAAVALFGSWFFVALVLGLVAIRRRDVATHREWMIRMVAMALGVVGVRLWALPLAALTREGPATWFSHSVWLGFATSVLVAEGWIRLSPRSREVVSSNAAVQ